MSKAETQSRNTDERLTAAAYKSQSWQIEMLIAGGTLITLASLSDEIRHYFFRVYPLVEFSHYRIVMLFGVFLVTRILLFGFTANLILRSVWLAYLGVSFSFPDGINYDRVKSVKAKNKLRDDPSVSNRVRILERLCNLSYSLAILLSIFAASTFISLIIVTYALSLVGLTFVEEEPIYSYIISFFIIFVQIGLLDRLLFSSKNKRSKAVTTVKWWISIVFSFVTLSFLFRRELLVIKTNVDRYVYSFIIIAVFGLATFVTAVQIGEFYSNGTLKWDPMDDRKNYAVPYSPKSHWYQYDTNLQDNSVVFAASIQSDVISDDYLRLFVVSWRTFDKYLEYAHKKYDFPLTEPDTWTKEKREYMDTHADSLYSHVLNDLFVVTLDDDLLGDLVWRRSTHPTTREQGYLTYISLDSIDNAYHSLDLDVRYITSKDSVVVGDWSTIEFYKQ